MPHKEIIYNFIILILIGCIGFVLIQLRDFEEETNKKMDVILDMDHTHIEISLLSTEIKQLHTQLKEMSVGETYHQEKFLEIEEQIRQVKWAQSTFEERLVEIQRRLSP